VKETGAVVPALFACWLLFERRYRNAAWFLLPVPAWPRGSSHSITHGTLVRQRCICRYNVNDALHRRTCWAPPAPLLLSLHRLRHIIGSRAGVALGRMPLLRDRRGASLEFCLRPVLAVSLLGGATLERYLLRCFQSSSSRLRSRCALSANARVRSRWRASRLPDRGKLRQSPTVSSRKQSRVHDSCAWNKAPSRRWNSTATLSRRSLVAASFPVSNALRDPDFGTRLRAARSGSNCFTRAETDRIAAQAPDMVVFLPPLDPLHLLDHPPRALTHPHLRLPTRTQCDQIAARFRCA